MGMETTEVGEVALAGHCAETIEAVAARLGRRFRRQAAARRAAGYLRWLLADVERKNGWQLPKPAGYGHPQGIQRVLDRYAWDADAVRDDLRAYVLAELGHPPGILTVDETGFLKQGTKSVVVVRQYSGTAGKVEDCPIGVFVGYVSPKGRAGIDRSCSCPATRDVAYGTALVPWVAGAYTLPSTYRTPRDAGRRWLAATRSFLALAATALVQPVYTAIDHLLAYPNIARLPSNSSTLLACWCVLNFLGHPSGVKNRGGWIRATGLILIAALLATAALFLTAPAYPEALDFPERYAQAAHVLGYRLVYLAYVALTDVTMTRLCWQYAMVASHESLRLGLRIVAAGVGRAALRRGRRLLPHRQSIRDRRPAL